MFNPSEEKITWNWNYKEMFGHLQDCKETLIILAGS